MAIVTFYEKPGCINNTRQKKLLADAGHVVHAKNLLTTSWTTTQLMKFFDGLPVAEWFNQSAPQIKSGDVDPRRLTPAKALTLMLSEPILIRRPLMVVESEYRIGFDQSAVDQWIGLSKPEFDKDLESCPKSHEHKDCA